MGKSTRLALVIILLVVVGGAFLLDGKKKRKKNDAETVVTDLQTDAGSTALGGEDPVRATIAGSNSNSTAERSRRPEPGSRRTAPDARRRTRSRPTEDPTRRPRISSSHGSTYTVKDDDTPVKIWRDLFGTARGWRQLLALNPGVDPRRLRIGMKLTVPDRRQLPARVRHRELERQPAPAPSQLISSTGDRIHVVRRGEILESISRLYYGKRQHWWKIAEANQIRDPRKVREGMKLVIPRL